jgi:hypothetical protein
VDSFGGVTFSQCVVYLIEDGLRVAILRSSKITTEDQNQTDRQQP